MKLSTTGLKKKEIRLWRPNGEKINDTYQQAIKFVSGAKFKPGRAMKDERTRKEDQNIKGEDFRSIFSYFYSFQRRQYF